MYCNLDTASMEYVSPDFKTLEELHEYNRKRNPNYDNEYGTFKFRGRDCVIIYCRRKDD